MRAISYVAATIIVALAAACGGSGNGSGITSPSDTTHPIASFTSSCTGPTCTFTNTSSDPDGKFTSSWNFGDQSPPDTTTSPSHTYAATIPTPYTVTLTVTDNGGLTATANQTVTVTPVSDTLSCTNHTGAADSTAECVMGLAQKTIIIVTVQSTNCQFVGNTFVMPSPAATPADTLFRDGCNMTLVPVGTVYTINGPNPDKSFPAGTQVQAQFIQGHRKPTDPPKGPPATRLTGTFPDWTIAIDDGGNLGGPGEPNFTDIVLTVHAAAAP